MNILDLLNGNNYGVFNRPCARLIGLHTTIILTELLSKHQYYRKKNLLVQLPEKDGDWFYLTAEAFEERTTLTEKEQRPCIRKLISLGFIKKEVSGIPAKRYFQLDTQKIIDFFQNETISTSLDKRPDLFCQKDKTGLDKRPAIESNINPYIESEEYKESAIPPPHPSSDPPKSRSKESKPKEKPEMPKEASDLAQDLLSRVKTIHPKLKDPDLVKWAKELELINRRDSRSWEEISSMIEWAFEDRFWFKVIQSPSSLRDHWDKMAIQRTPASNAATNTKKNMDLCHELHTYLKSKDRSSEIRILSDSVYCEKAKEWIKFSLPRETFLQLIERYTGIKVADG